MGFSEEAICLCALDIFNSKAKIIWSIYCSRMDLFYIWAFDITVCIIQYFIVIIPPFVLWK
jgi:hypothetical protein